MALKTTTFDVADYLENEADMAEYLSEALALEDPAYFQHAPGAVEVRSRKSDSLLAKRALFSDF